MTKTSCSALLLFGATGDLSRRMLLPSLYALHEDGLIDPTLRIVGTARSKHDDGAFRTMARTALEEFLPADRKDEAQLATFLERLEYQTLDASGPEGFARLGEKLGDTSCGLRFSFQPHLRFSSRLLKGCASRALRTKGCGLVLKSRWAMI